MEPGREMRELLHITSCHYPCVTHCCRRRETTRLSISTTCSPRNSPPLRHWLASHSKDWPGDYGELSQSARRHCALIPAIQSRGGSRTYGDVTGKAPRKVSLCPKSSRVVDLDNVQGLSVTSTFIPRPLRCRLHFCLLTLCASLSHFTLLCLKVIRLSINHKSVVSASDRHSITTPPPKPISCTSLLLDTNQPQ